MLFVTWLLWWFPFYFIAIRYSVFASDFYTFCFRWDSFRRNFEIYLIPGMNFVLKLINWITFGISESNIQQFIISSFFSPQNWGSHYYIRSLDTKISYRGPTLSPFWMLEKRLTTFILKIFNPISYGMQHAACIQM